MLLIAAALEEELRIAKDLCPGCKRLTARKLRLWQSTAAGRPVIFLKTGVGPNMATTKLLAALAEIAPSRILIVGYAGALDPQLRVGDVLAVQHAFLLGNGAPKGTPLESLIPSEVLELSTEDLREGMRRGKVVTTQFLIGEPAQKAQLYARFGAAAVDMETAAFALAARSVGIPLSCVRAITDDARDEFLAPVSYDPEASMGKKTLRVVTAGNWVRRYRDWTERAALARNSLRLFLRQYLQNRDAM
jgi:adenosylhomocysteine nucleosidase